MNILVRPAYLVSGLFLVTALTFGAWAIYAADAPAAEENPPAVELPVAETPAEEPPAAVPPAEEAPAEEAPAKPPKEPARLQPIEAPKSPGGTVTLPRTPLLKENTRLINVEGLILDLKDDLKASPVSRAVFQPKDGSGYFILLENALLEKVLTETAHGERPVRVRGTITVFRRRNYLQLDSADVQQE